METCTKNKVAHLVGILKMCLYLVQEFSEWRANKGKTNQMQQIMIYWQSVVPENVSGVFTPIIKRADSVNYIWCSFLAVAVVVSESRVARYVHCAEDVV